VVVVSRFGSYFNIYSDGLYERNSKGSFDPVPEARANLFRSKFRYELTNIGLLAPIDDEILRVQISL